MLREVEEALSVRRRDLVQVDADLDSATDRYMVFYKQGCVAAP